MSRHGANSQGKLRRPVDVVAPGKEKDAKEKDGEHLLVARSASGASSSRDKDYGRVHEAHGV